MKKKNHMKKKQCWKFINFLRNSIYLYLCVCMYVYACVWCACVRVYVVCACVCIYLNFQQKPEMLLHRPQRSQDTEYFIRAVLSSSYG